MAGKISNVEASFLRYLYENLTKVDGTPVYEDVQAQVDQDAVTWVVIDTMTAVLGPQPNQTVYVHIAQKLNAPNSKAKMTELVDRVAELLDEGSNITLYDVDTEEEIGTIFVHDPSLLPSVFQRNGGSYRTIGVELVFQG